METETAPADGPITVDAMVAERREARESAAEASTEAVETETEQAEAVESAPSEQASLEADDTELEGDQTPTDTDELETVNEGEQEETEAEGTAPSIDAPHFWPEDAKQHFSSLDPVTQAYVAHQDKLAQAAVTKAQEEVSAKVRTQTAQITHEYQGKLMHLEQSVEVAEALTLAEYGLSDQQLAQAIIQGYDANEVQQYKINRDAHKEKLEALKAQVNQVKEQQFDSFVKAEQVKLAEIAPDLTDNATLTQVGKFLADAGRTQEELRHASAADLSLAYDAMRWRNSQAALANKPKPKPTPPKVMKSRGNKSAQPRNAQLAKLKSAADGGDMEAMLAYRKAKRAAA